MLAIPRTFLFGGLVRTVFVTDVHLGNHAQCGGPVTLGQNHRCQLILQTIRKIPRDVHLVVLGDLLDSTAEDVRILATLKALLEEFALVTLLKGNHESFSGLVGDHSLGVLASHKTSVKVVDTPRVVTVGSTAFYCVPFQSGKGDANLKKAVDGFFKLKDDPKIGDKVLLLHYGIRDKGTAPWLQDAADSVGIENVFAALGMLGARWAFAGNWHSPSEWSFQTGSSELKVVQVGALVPTGWDNPGWDYGRAYSLDSSGVRFETLPGPRFFVVTSAEELFGLVQANVEKKCNLYVRWDCSSDPLEAAQLLDQLTRDFKITAGQVRMLGQSSSKGVEDVAQTVVSLGGESTARAVAEFVAESMELGHGVDAGAVVDLACSYLGV